jgi:hypothetical protein
MDERLEQVLVLLGAAVGITGLAIGTPLSVRVGAVVGLLGQVGWIRSSLRHRQWGIFAVSVYFTLVYLWAGWNAP